MERLTAITAFSTAMAAMALMTMMTQLDTVQSSTDSNIFKQHQLPISADLVQKLGNYDRECRKEYCPKLDITQHYPCGGKKRANRNARCVNSKTAEDGEFVQNVQANMWKLCMKKHNSTKMIGTNWLQFSYQETFANAVHCGWYKAMKMENVSSELLVDAVTKAQAFCAIVFQFGTIDTVAEEDDMNKCIKKLWKAIDETPVTTVILTQYSVTRDNSLKYSALSDYINSLVVMDNTQQQDVKELPPKMRKARRMRRTLQNLIPCLRENNIAATEENKQTTKAPFTPYPGGSGENMPQFSVPEWSGNGSMNAGTNEESGIVSAGVNVSEPTGKPDIPTVSDQASNVQPGNSSGNDTQNGQSVMRRGATELLLRERRTPDYDYNVGKNSGTKGQMGNPDNMQYDYFAKQKTTTAPAESDSREYEPFTEAKYVERKVKAIECAYKKSELEDDDLDDGFSQDYNFGAPGPTQDPYRKGAAGKDSTGRVSVDLVLFIGTIIGSMKIVIELI